MQTKQFEVHCSLDEKEQGSDFWDDVWLGLLEDRHPAAIKVWGIQSFSENEGEGIVPAIIGNYLRRLSVSFGKKKFEKLAVDIVKAKKLVSACSRGSAWRLQRIEEADLNDLGAEFASDIEFIGEELEKARIALVGAEIVANRILNYSKGKQRSGLDVALMGSPLKTMAIQLARVWLSHGYSLDGGRSGDGLDEVIVRIVEVVGGQKDRGPRKWLSELMTDLRKEIST